MHTRRVNRSQRQSAGDRRRSRHRKTAGGGVHTDRPDQYERIRVLGSRPQSALWHAAQPIRPCPRQDSRRFVVRRRCFGIRWNGGCRTRHRHRRLVPNSSRHVRRRRIQADGATHIAARCGSAVVQPGFRRLPRQYRCLLRGDRFGHGGFAVGVWFARSAAGIDAAWRPPQRRSRRRRRQGSECFR